MLDRSLSQISVEFSGSDARGGPYGPTSGREGESHRGWRGRVRDIGPVLGNKVPSRGDLRLRSSQFKPGIQNGRRTCAKPAISGRIFKLFFLDSWSRRASTEYSHGRLANSNIAAAPGLQGLKQPFPVGFSNFFFLFPRLPGRRVRLRWNFLGSDAGRCPGGPASCPGGPEGAPLRFLCRRLRDIEPGSGNKVRPEGATAGRIYITFSHFLPVWTWVLSS